MSYYAQQPALYAQQPALYAQHTGKHPCYIFLVTSHLPCYIHENHAPFALQSVLTGHALTVGTINIWPANLP